MSVKRDASALPELTEENEDEEKTAALRESGHDNIRFKVTSSGYVRQCCHVNCFSERCVQQETNSVTVNVKLLLTTVVSGAIYTPHSVCLIRSN